MYLKQKLIKILLQICYFVLGNIENISELTESLLEIVPKSLGLQKTDDFHISLTKTFVLKYHWIDSFVESVKKILIPINRYRTESRTNIYIINLNLHL